MKYTILLFALSLAACAAPPMPEPQDRALQLDYMKSVAERKAYRPEVYAEPEFESDCDFYKMPECYE